MRFLIFIMTFVFALPLYGEKEQTDLCEESPGSFLRKMNLEEAIEITLRNQREIQISQMDIAEQRGIVKELAGPFDPVVDSTLDHVMTEDRQDFGSGLRSDYGAHETVAGVNIRKQTRLGTRFSLTAEVDQIIDPFGALIAEVPDKRSNQGFLSFQVEQPILRGFLYGNDVTLERASRRELLAAILENLHIVSLQVTDTTRKYWDVVAAKELVKIRKTSLERFTKLKAKTQILVDNQELAKSDILQPQAQVSQALVELALSKQLLYSEVQVLLLDLGVAEIGLDVKIQDLDVQDFPEIPEDLPVSFEVAQNYIQYSAYARNDIRAARVRESAADILIKGGYNDLLPRLDLVAGVNKQDFRTRSKYNPLYRSLDMPHPETDYVIGLRFSYPICNHAARGALYQRKAIRQRLSLFTQQLIQDTTQEIISVWSDQISLSHALKNNSVVVEKNHKLVENELKKLRSGFSTLFVLIDFENRLTNALIERVDLRRRFMQNIVTLRFLTGALVSPATSFDCYTIEDVTTMPEMAANDHSSNSCDCAGS